jgi:hypothetical protein
MLEKERCYVTRTAWRAPVYEMKELYWASVDPQANALLELPKESLSSVVWEDRRLNCFAS